MNQRAKLFHGGHRGTEAEFGRCAERWGIAEETVSFAGHTRERSTGLRELTVDELAKGDVSMDIVSQRLGRRFAAGHGIRRVIRAMFHVVTSGDHLFVVGWIQPDGTVKGGTGWGVELARFFNRHVSVFDQGDERWYTWRDGGWQEDEPLIAERAFSATGTRDLTEAGQRAIGDLFERSFGPAPVREA
jgi:hypothetical protein